MSQSRKPVKDKIENTQVEAPLNLMKVHSDNLIVNSLSTNFEFTRQFGVELIKGSATPEHINVLKLSIEGLEDFIELLKEKMQEKKA